MSPSKFHHASKDVANSTTNHNNGYNWVPPPLKINKNSHSIKKSSPSPPSSSSSSSSLLSKPPTPPPPPPPPPPSHQQQRHPVIIYTHSPKVIHTHPKDFMALVQKLTGLSRPEDGEGNPRTKPEPGDPHHPPPPPQPPSEAAERKMIRTLKAPAAASRAGDDEAASSAVTEECGMSSCSATNNAIRSSHGGQLRIGSCYVPPQQPSPCSLMNNIPVFASGSADFFCPNQPFYNYSDPFLFGGSNGMRTHHVPSSPSTVLLEGLNEFREY